MEATSIDILFAKKAVVKKLQADLKAEEDAAKEAAIDDWKAGKGGQVRSPLFGNKAGYITVKEGADPRTVEEFHVVDRDALYEWFDREDLETDGFAYDYIDEFAEWHLKATGECPDGCTAVRYETEKGEPTAAFTVKEKVVIERILSDESVRQALAGSVPLMLEGGGDGLR